jgi:DNA polymerase-1
MRCVVDIETDGLIKDATTIHCIVAADIDTGQGYIFKQRECYTDFPVWATQVDNFIMHNGISFDAPVINKLIGETINLNSVTDTLILSQLYNPMREGGHSLKEWGNKLSLPKQEIDSFSSFTEEMLDYCKQDINITYKLYNELKSEGRNFSYRSAKLEHSIRAVINKQERNGFALDLPYAMTLQGRFEDESERIEKDLQEIFEPIVTIRHHKRSGKRLLDHVEIFNPASRKQIAERLMNKGWEPKQRTPKGNIIVDESVLAKIDMPEAKAITRYLLLQKRASQIKSWVEAAGDDGRVHGRVLTLKTVTGRMAHYAPNMAQVPASYSPYGEECRNCWTVSNKDTHTLVGTDASGLELRALAHYMNNDSFIQEILEGDIHTANQKMAGLPDRASAKTFIYALLYGAGPEKIGSIVGGSASTGKKLIDTYLSNLPTLKLLRNQVQEASIKGKIRGLDGRYHYTRSPHSSLNTLIQGAGAIICKDWLLNILDGVDKLGLDAKLVASIHDEYQFEVAKIDAERFGQLTGDAMKITEEGLAIKCPLDSEFKVGETWATTH